jgi:hypothetical protein
VNWIAEALLADYLAELCPAGSDRHVNNGRPLVY